MRARTFDAGSRVDHFHQFWSGNLPSRDCASSDGDQVDSSGKIRRWSQGHRHCSGDSCPKLWRVLVRHAREARTVVGSASRTGESQRMCDTRDVGQEVRPEDAVHDFARWRPEDQGCEASSHDGRTRLEIEFGVELSEVVQVAILTGLLPNDRHDNILETGRVELPCRCGNYQQAGECTGPDSNRHWANSKSFHKELEHSRLFCGKLCLPNVAVQEDFALAAKPHLNKRHTHPKSKTNHWSDTKKNDKRCRYNTAIWTLRFWKKRALD